MTFIGGTCRPAEKVSAGEIPQLHLRFMIDLTVREQRMRP